MPEPVKSVLKYLLALLIPIAIGAMWPWTHTIYPFPASVLFLAIAVIARFFGFREALLCTFASIVVFWGFVPDRDLYPFHVQAVRVLMFTAASLVVASVSRQRSKEVRAAEERQRALFDAAMDAILFVDQDGRFIDANLAATALFGYSRQELTEKRVGDLSLPEDRPAAIEKFRRAITEKEKARGETVIVRKDGIRRDVEFRAVSNALPGIHFVMMHDITARKEAERSLQHLSGRLLQLQDEERRRIARQLHDTTAQSLAAIRLNLTRISRSPAAASGAIKEAVDESVALTEQSIAEIRTLSYLLHPPMIDEIGLLPSLRWFVRGFEERSGITTTLEADDGGSRLPRELETAVFRIVQEALTNIQRHSGSEIAEIRLERQPQRLQLVVEDEGRGLPQDLRDYPNAVAASGVGIAGIQQRARELGGQMEMRSTDRGTRLVVTLPIPDA